MEKMKNYKVRKGLFGEEVGIVMATSLNNACQKYINSLSCPTEWDFKLHSREVAHIVKFFNYNEIEFVIHEL